MTTISPTISTGKTADDIQSLPLDVVGMRKTYPDGALSLWHSHPRHQLVYAVSGMMLAETAAARWAVPAGHGLAMPAGTRHQIRMAGRVDLQTLYIRPGAPDADALQGARIIAISPLLAQLIAGFTLLQNPWPATERARHLSRLILLDLTLAPDQPLALPFPAHPGLRRVCDGLVRAPGDTRPLDHWAEHAGLSRRSFTRHFARETGLSFGKWLGRLRRQVALAELAEGRPLSRVAHDLGYGSAHALRRVLARAL